MRRVLSLLLLGLTAGCSVHVVEPRPAPVTIVVVAAEPMPEPRIRCRKSCVRRDYGYRGLHTRRLLLARSKRRNFGY